MAEKSNDMEVILTGESSDEVVYELNPQAVEIPKRGPKSRGLKKHIREIYDNELEIHDLEHPVTTNGQLCYKCISHIFSLKTNYTQEKCDIHGKAVRKLYAEGRNAITLDEFSKFTKENFNITIEGQNVTIGRFQPTNLMVRKILKYEKENVKDEKIDKIAETVVNVKHEVESLKKQDNVNLRETFHTQNERNNERFEEIERLLQQGKTREAEMHKRMENMRDVLAKAKKVINNQGTMIKELKEQSVNEEMIKSLKTQHSDLYESHNTFKKNMEEEFEKAVNERDTELASLREKIKALETFKNVCELEKPSKVTRQDLDACKRGTSKLASIVRKMASTVTGIVQTVNANGDLVKKLVAESTKSPERKRRNSAPDVNMHDVEVEMGEVINQMNTMNEDLGRAYEEMRAQKRAHAQTDENAMPQALTFLATLDPNTGRLRLPKRKTPNETPENSPIQVPRGTPIRSITVTPITTATPTSNSPTQTPTRQASFEPTPGTSKQRKTPKCKFCKIDYPEGNKYGYDEEGNLKEYYCLRCVMSLSREGCDDVDIEEELNEFTINEVEEIRKAKKALNKALENQAETVTTPIVGHCWKDINKENRDTALRDLEILNSMEDTLTREIVGLDGTGTDDERLLLMDTLESNEEKYEPEEEGGEA